MRFDYLNLRAFGHFTDYELSFDPSKNFHLIYGPNEAGKSTTLRSITHFLYGFPQKTNDSFLHSNTKLRIEGQIKNSQGEALQFIRRKGKKDTVLDLNGNALNEKVVDQFLQGISESHFLNMFALDHVRLREGGESLLQSGGSVGESVFSAASGINVLRKILEELEKKSGALYKKTGSNPELNKLIKQEKELKKQISENQLKIQTWKELERTYNEGKQEIERIILQVRQLRSEQEKLQRIKHTLPKVARLREINQRLKDLGDVPDLPDQIEILRSQAEHSLESATKVKNNAQEEAMEIEQQMKEIDIPEKILDQAAFVDGLYQEVKSYQNNKNEVPELAGQKNQLEEQVLSYMKEIQPIHADIETVDRYRLSAEQKGMILTLIKQKPLLDKDLERIEKEQKNKAEELQQKKDQLQAIPDLPNIDKLEAVINQVKRAGDIEQSLKVMIHDSKQQQMQMNEEIRLLPQWDGTYQDLLDLPVPGLSETVKKFEKNHIDLVNKLQKTEEHLKNQQKAIEGYEDRIRELDSLVEIPSEDKLLHVRSHRDQGWKLIRTQLQQGTLDAEQLLKYTNGEEIEAVYEDQVRVADYVADTMRKEAAKVGEKNKLLSDIKMAQKKIEELKQEETSLKEEMKAWESDWHQLWKSSGITPLTPEEMREWLTKYGQIKSMIFEHIKTQAAIHEHEQDKEQLKQQLMTALNQLVPVSNNHTLDELLNMAETQQKEIQNHINQRDRLEAAIGEVTEKMKVIAHEKLDIETQISHWKSNWMTAIQGTDITENTLPVVAESLLTKYETCTQAYDDYQKVVQRQMAIQEQMIHYEQKVKNVLQTVSMPVDEQHIDIAVNQLHLALQKAQQDQVTMLNFKSRFEELKLKIKHINNEIHEAESILQNLIKEAKCHTIEELKEVEKTFAVKKEYVANIQAIETEFLEFGNGHSLQEIIDEADQYKFVSMEVDLDEIKRKLEAIEVERSQLEQDHGAVKKEFEEKIQGSNTASVLAEQKKESILAKASSITEQYIQTKLAYILLQKGIEYYRSQNQDPILQRASELFAQLTLQSFASLIVDYDEKDQPVLMGVRENGDKVPIDGMSDGTTDQLYLSLRIASIEKYVNENEPVPFIVDDILVHFDDIRSKETLKILLELSRHTQIIFFTHHARLIDLMNEITSDQAYQLTEINQNATSLSL